MKILQLNLKKQWFDAILSGEKTEEYREDKPYWQKRLLHPFYPIIKQFREHDAIRFSNGYAKDRRQMLIELKNIEIGVGYAPWGATGDTTFILKLGKILEIKNCGTCR